MCGDREFAESTVNKGKIEEPSKGTSSLLLLRLLDGQALYLVLLSGEAVTSHYPQCALL